VQLFILTLTVAGVLLTVMGMANFHLGAELPSADACGEKTPERCNPAKNETRTMVPMLHSHGAQKLGYPKT